MRGVDALTEMMLKITGYVMYLAPLAAFASIAAVVAVNGLDILLTLGKFIASFYLALLLLWAILLTGGYVVLGGASLRLLIRSIREPLLVAFTTADAKPVTTGLRLRAFTAAGSIPRTSSCRLQSADRV